LPQLKYLNPNSILVSNPFLHITMSFQNQNHQRTAVGRKPPPPKYYGWDGKYTLSAGGLIPYDADGFWCVVEQNSANPADTKLTDVGGKYRFEDMDIDGCIAREWNEETYGIAELRRADVQKIRKSPLTQSAYIMTNNGERPTYLCLFVAVVDFGDLDEDTNEELFKRQVTAERFTEARNYAIKVNDRVPAHEYKTLQLRYIRFDQIDESRKTETWSYRLTTLVPQLQKHIDTMS